MMSQVPRSSAEIRSASSPLVKTALPAPMRTRTRRSDVFKVDNPFLRSVGDPVDHGVAEEVSIACIQDGFVMSRTGSPRRPVQPHESRRRLPRDGVHLLLRFSDLPEDVFV